MSRRSKRQSTPGMKHKMEELAIVRETCRRCDDLIAQGNPLEAIHIMKPLEQAFPYNADVQYYLGYAHGSADYTWQAVFHYRKALEISADPVYYEPLAVLYTQLGLGALAIDAIRRSLRTGGFPGMQDEARRQLSGLEEDLQALADKMSKPLKEVERGMQFKELAQIELHQGDFKHSIHHGREATRLLGDYPPARNNLARALFYDGQVEEAARLERQVQANQPDNIMALVNLVRILAWNGDAEGARQQWKLLQKLTPADSAERHAMMEAAAILEDDEAVYQLGCAYQNHQESRDVDEHSQLLLGIAEANLGLASAVSRLDGLKAQHPWVSDVLEAIREGRSGVGIGQRFAYYSPLDLISAEDFARLADLLEREARMTPEQFRKQIERYTQRFPQLPLIGEKLLMEDKSPDIGIHFLAKLGCEQCWGILREFAGGKEGTDDLRFAALEELYQGGQISSTDPLHIWWRGKWVDMHLNRQMISDEPQRTYSQRVTELIERGTEALEEGDTALAEECFQQAIQLEPHAMEAYNNLAVIHSKRKEFDHAVALLKRAVKMDPHYTMGRCNLASFLLDVGRLQEAREMIDPLVDAEQYSPLEFARLSYVRARIHLQDGDIEAARNNLELGLKMVPDYHPALDLLESIEKQ
jgi:tetratricopeptide (TPR) repeat protein